MQATKNGAWGFIVRDFTGDHVLAGAGNAGQLHDALMAEAVSCLKALETTGGLFKCSEGCYNI